MASRTAEGFYVTLVNGAQYLSDYFKYTGKENILSEIKVKTLGKRIIQVAPCVKTSISVRRTRDEVSSTYTYAIL